MSKTHAATILIVEDEPVTAMDLEELLDGWGYRVLGPCRTASEALALVDQERPDLALLDVQLADETRGTELGRVLASRGVASVFLTAFTDSVVEEEAKLAAPIGFLAKPFSPSEMRLTISMALATAESQRARRDQAAFQQALLEGAGAAIIATTTEGTITHFNPAAEALLGYRADEMIGKCTLGVFHDPAEVAARATELSAELGRTIEPGFDVFVLLSRDGQAETREWTYVRKDGAHVPVLLSVTTLFADDGAINGYLGIARDIASRKAAENTIVALLQDLQDLQRAVDQHALVSVTDVSGKITLVNDKFCEVAGYSRDELIGQSHRLINSGHHPKAFFADLWQTIGAGKVWTGEIKNRRKDGTEYWVAATIAPLGPQNGKPTRYMAIRTEITRRKAAEEQLRILNEGLGALVEERARALQDAERQAMRGERAEAMGVLAGGIAHDLNNAMAPVAMGLDLLRTSYPEASSTLDLMAASIERSTGMIKRLLQFSKQRAGLFDFVDVRSIIEEIAEVVAPILPKNIRLVARSAPGLPGISADATQLSQILMNLCLNARDAMPRGGTLTIEAAPVHCQATPPSASQPLRPLPVRQGDYIMVSVQDTGTGMPNDTLAQLFMPFFTTKAEDKGTGLGLASVMASIKTHHGFIEVESELGTGSTFRVYLPLTLILDRVEAAPVTEYRKTSSPSSTTPVILVVDDETPVRVVTGLILERAGFAPLLASSAVEALDLLQRHGPAIAGILTDLAMPGMDGITFVRYAREAQPDIPIMVCSALISQQASNALAELYVDAILSKPLTQTALLDQVRRMVEARRSAR